MKVTITQLNVPPPIPAAVVAGIVAMPGGQANATPLTGRVNIVSTIAPNTGVKLSILLTHQQTVMARGGRPLTIYPIEGTAIEGNGVNVPVTIADLGTATFTFDGLLTWLIS